MNDETENQAVETSDEAVQTSAAVTMKGVLDGVVINFGKRQVVTEKNPDDLTVTFAFCNGESRKFSFDDLPEAMKAQIITQGMAAVVGDSYSGQPVVEDKVLTADEKWKSLVEGNWTMRSSSGVKGLSDTIMAFMEVATDEDTGEKLDPTNPDHVALAKETVLSWSAADIEVFQKMPEIKTIIAGLKAERAAAKAAEARASLAQNAPAGLKFSMKK